MYKNNLKNLFNEIEKNTLCGLGADDDYTIENEIESAVDEEKNYIVYNLGIEQIEIEWDNDFNYTINNITTLDKDTIQKAYAVSEATEKSPYKVLNERGGQYEGQKFIDKFSFYKYEEKEDIINEWLENAIEEDSTEDDIKNLKESFENQFEEFTRVTGGYVEESN